FKVSGVIAGTPWLSHGDVTIAGQTSPGGVIVRGFDTTESPYCDGTCGPGAQGTQNWILRHVRVRPAGGDFPDGIRMRYTKRAIVDHVSVGNAQDEAVEISYSNQITVQNTIIAETVGSHAQYGGVLLNYTNPAAGYALDQITLHHNNWNRIQGRMPELSRESGADAANTTMQIEVANNLLWDPGFYMDVNATTTSGDPTTGSAIYYQLNWVGNYSFARSTYPYGMMWFPVNRTNLSTVYLADNLLNRYPSRTGWALVYCCNDFASAPSTATAPSYARATRHPFPAVTYTSSATLRDYVVANVGAFPRDAMDRRLIGFVRNGTIDTRDPSTNPANDALTLDFTTAPTAPTDTDLDGMPDAWETAHGLNPAVQDHNGTALSLSMYGVAGYTNLECYLQELSQNRIAGL
ncbi:MAG: hypothetical protein U0325_36510, partial [Polyangiales bacterium]